MDQPKIFSSVEAHRRSSEEKTKAQKDALKFQSPDAVEKLSLRVDSVEASIDRLDMAIGKLLAFLTESQDKQIHVPPPPRVKHVSKGSPEKES